MFYVYKINSRPRATSSSSSAFSRNTKYTEKLADEGKIADGDYFKVTATFFKNDMPVCTEEFYLVDYTGAEHKIVKDWTAWDMKTARGYDVDAVKFSVSSTTLLPTFCLDILLASVAVEY